MCWKSNMEEQGVMHNADFHCILTTWVSKSGTFSKVDVFSFLGILKPRDYRFIVSIPLRLFQIGSRVTAFTWSEERHVIRAVLSLVSKNKRGNEWVEHVVLTPNFDPNPNQKI